MREHVFIIAGFFSGLGDLSRFFQVLGHDVGTSFVGCRCGMDEAGNGCEVFTRAPRCPGENLANERLDRFGLVGEEIQPECDKGC